MPLDNAPPALPAPKKLDGAALGAVLATLRRFVEWNRTGDLDDLDGLAEACERAEQALALVQSTAPKRSSRKPKREVRQPSYFRSFGTNWMPTACPSVQPLRTLRTAALLAAGYRPAGRSDDPRIPGDRFVRPSDGDALVVADCTGGLYRGDAVIQAEERFALEDPVFPRLNRHRDGRMHRVVARWCRMAAGEAAA